MATNNAYAAYKRDTRYLVYWMINTCNGIIKSLPPGDDADAAQVALNLSGQTTVSGLVNMSNLIATHMKTIPPIIYRLLRSVIKARSAANALFQKMAACNPDPELERINATHRHFIDALDEAFRNLRGIQWMEEMQHSAREAEQDDVEQTILNNQFMALHTGDDGDDDDDEEETEPANEPETTQPRRRPQARPKKGKGKKKKAGWKGPDADQGPEGVPLESYCIIEDEGGVHAGYLVALYGLFKELAKLRANLQEAWREVAYEGLNSAVAGAMSHVTFTMAKRMSSDIFLDFPGYDSYETVMNTITGGDPGSIDGAFQISLLRLTVERDAVDTMTEAILDIKEHFLIHTYNDMMDFLTDFQKTHSGKPTKRMMSQIARWNPYEDLYQISHDERVKWRRSYTINWLYDLVNLYSATVVQRNTTRGQNHDLSTIDWSPTGPWADYRRLYGLNEFAGFMTTLAFQKNGTNIRPRILPHHVLQLQCIVDAMVVSRGWAVDLVQSYILTSAADFKPTRDIDLFLDRNSKADGHGFLQAVDVIQHTLRKEEILHKDAPIRHGYLSELLQIMQDDFRDWLGESKYKNGLETMPPSRFSHVDPNGLWAFSPFLCGSGLLECLELAYGTGMVAWDRIPEVLAVVHLHNMLVHKGYIKNPVGLFVSMTDLFPRQFFCNGDIPETDFPKALLARLKEARIKAPQTQRIRERRKKTALDVHEMLTVKDNFMFTVMPFTNQLRAANFDPERIPDKDLPVTSLVATTRLGRSKVIKDPRTGKRKLQDSELVRRAIADGITEKSLLDLSDYWTGILEGEKQPTPEYLDSLGHTIEWESTEAGGRASFKDMSCTEIVNIARWDVFRDVSADGPLLSLNYIWVAARIMVMYMNLEKKLDELRNPMYIEAYEKQQRFERNRRVGLTLMAMTSEDDECLKAMAAEFEYSRAGFMHHMYWNDIENSKTTMRNMRDRREECPVM